MGLSITNKISIIIPFFNPNNSFFSELMNIVSNLPSFIEVVLVNDGSTMDYEYLKLLKDTNNIKYVELENNQGVSNARNIGIQQSSGEYLMFVDSDDLFNSKLLLNFIKNNRFCDNDLYCFSFASNPEDFLPNNPANSFDNPIIVNPLDAYSHYLYFNNSLSRFMFRSACGKIFKKRIITEFNIFFNKDLTHFEDADFLAQFLSKANGCALFNLPFYYYRNNVNSASKSYISDVVSKFEIYFRQFEIKNYIFRNTLFMDTLYLLLPTILLNIKKDKGHITHKEIYRTLHLPFVLKSFEELKIQKLDTNIKYLNRIISLYKTSRFLFIPFYLSHYLRRYF